MPKGQTPTKGACARGSPDGYQRVPKGQTPSTNKGARRANFFLHWMPLGRDCLFILTSCFSI